MLIVNYTSIPKIPQGTQTKDRWRHRNKLSHKLARDVKNFGGLRMREVKYSSVIMRYTLFYKSHIVNLALFQEHLLSHDDPNAKKYFWNHLRHTKYQR